VTENLSQTHEIVAGIGQELMGHRVAEQMRVQGDAGDRRVFIEKRPDASIRQWASLAYENPTRSDWRSRLQIRLQCTAGWYRQRDRSLLAAFAESKHGRATSVGKHKVVQFQGNEVAHTAAGIKEERENCIGSQILPQFNLSQQSPHLAPVETSRSELLAAKLLDALCEVRLQLAVLGKPVKVAADGDQAAIDGRYGLTLIPSQGVLEVGHVSDCDSLDGERFSICMAEPTSELSQIGADRPASVRS
jgi:hypothetical protein